jgi:hypothetical protein
MVPHKQTSERHYVLQTLFNKKLSWARVLVDNNFKNILKKTFSELVMKSNLNVLILLDVGCCRILHNMILNGKDANIDELMVQLKVKNLG